MEKFRIAIIGYGAIGNTVVHEIHQCSNDCVTVAAVMVRSLAKYAEEAPRLRKMGILFTNDPDAFFRCQVDLVVEAAGQQAVTQYGIRALTAGADLMVTSIGAFTDDALYKALKTYAAEHHRHLYLVSGALPGAGWMYGSAIAGVDRVKIRQSKPVRSWQGTPAEALIDLHSVDQPTCFFSGSARQAAHRFPKSSNITAMLALCTGGLDATHVDLVADPEADQMQTSIAFSGKAGELNLEWRSVPSKLNPSTSMDVPFNVLKAIRMLCTTVKLAV